MLLRRVMKHVRDQNWFAVGIDFVIVVTGVFIGIQVANWNTERQNRALADNAYRFEAFAVNVLAEQMRLQQELHAHIDRRLNIDHESAAMP